MVGIDDIVITGLGCITPIGNGRHSFWQGLSCGKCGIRELFCSQSGDRVLYGATINEFDGKQYVVPRKALKLMSHEVQIAYAAAHLAWEDAGLTTQSLEPERVGVVFGSEMIQGDLGDFIPAIRNCTTGTQMDINRWGTEFSKAIYPLWMLRNLPNMPPCHVAIAVDARGPNNTIAQEEISGLLALGEAVGIMQRGDADVMIVGALGSRVNPTRFAYRIPGHYCEGRRVVDASGNPEPGLRIASHQGEDIKTYLSRAFDAESRGIVPSEAAVVMILEKRRHAVARSANLIGTLLATAGRFGRPTSGHRGSSLAIANAASAALEIAGISASDLACISAQGYSHRGLDQTEANAICQFADGIPVTAFSSYFGTAGSASGLLQLAAGILATGSRVVLPIHGFGTPDPSCPVAVCQTEQSTTKTHVLQLSFTFLGQAAATVVDCQ